MIDKPDAESARETDGKLHNAGSGADLDRRSVIVRLGIMASAGFLVSALPGCSDDAGDDTQDLDAHGDPQSDPSNEFVPLNHRVICCGSLQLSDTIDPTDLGGFVVCLVMEETLFFWTHSFYGQFDAAMLAWHCRE